MVRVQNLGKKQGREWIFRGLDFELRTGECLAILGANGAGKSTLLKIIAGLWLPSEGRVERPAPFELTCGYAALDMALYASLTAREHFELVSPGFRQVGEVLSRVGLEDTPKLVGEFSSGMRTRLKLSLASHHEPKVLLLDEPGASLDESGRGVVEAMVAGQLNRGCVILATNDPAERILATHEIVL